MLATRLCGPTRCARSAMNRRMFSNKMTGAPVIDLGELLDVDIPNKDMKCVEEIREACSTWGFFQVIA